MITADVCGGERRVNACVWRGGSRKVHGHATSTAGHSNMNCERFTFWRFTLHGRAGILILNNEMFNKH
jgi:hypothetical protein